MTTPGEPGQHDRSEVAPSDRRRGRHAAPDDDRGATASATASPSTASEAGVAAESDPAGEVVAEPGAERRRHAATGSSFRLPGWMIAVAGIVVLGLLAWLIIGLSSGGDDDTKAASSSSAAASEASTAAAPTAVDAASLPQVLCTGSSYVMVDTGQPVDQLLADPKGAEAKFPGSKLSTIPPGCVAGSDVRDEVVLALGPYTSIEEACAAGKALQGVQFTAYAGSADTGLTETTCP